MPGHSSMASSRASHSHGNHPPGYAPGNGPSGSLLPIPSWLTYLFDITAGTTELDGSEVARVYDQIGGTIYLQSDPSLGPTWDGTKATFNGSQYLYTTNATILALVNADDEPHMMALRGALTGTEATGRALGFSSTAANRMCGFGNDTAGSTGYRLQRTSTGTDATLAHVTTKQTWHANFTTGGLTNVLKYGTTTVVGPVDQSAAAAQAYTHFTVGGRFTSGGVGFTQGITMSATHIALKSSAMSAGEEAELLAYLGQF